MRQAEWPELHLVKGSTKPSGARRPAVFPEQACRPVQPPEAADQARMRPGPGRGLSGSCARRRLGPQALGSRSASARSLPADPLGGARLQRQEAGPPRGSPAGWAPPGLSPYPKKDPAPFPSLIAFLTPPSAQMMLSPTKPPTPDHPSSAHRIRSRWAAQTPRCWAASDLEPGGGRRQGRQPGRAYLHPPQLSRERSAAAGAPPPSTARPTRERIRVRPSTCLRRARKLLPTLPRTRSCPRSRSAAWPSATSPIWNHALTSRAGVAARGRLAGRGKRGPLGRPPRGWRWRRASCGQRPSAPDPGGGSHCVLLSAGRLCFLITKGRGCLGVLGLQGVFQVALFLRHPDERTPQPRPR